MAAQIKVIRLVTGEDIIGFIESFEDLSRHIKEIEKDKTITDIETLKALSKTVVFIRHVLQIYTKYDYKKKQHHLFMCRWLPYTNEEIVTISNDKLLTITIPTLEVEDHYLYNIQDLGLIGDKVASINSETIQNQAAENLLKALSTEKEPVN